MPLTPASQARNVVHGRLQGTTHRSDTGELWRDWELGVGTIEIGVTVHVDKASAAARQKVEAAGGSVEGRV